jgi:hypothetical protein
LEALAHAIFDTIAECGEAIIVMQITAGNRREGSRPMGDLVRAEIAALYQQGMSDGAFMACDPANFAAAAHGLVEGVMRRYLENPMPAAKEAHAKLTAEMLQRLALA